MCCTVVCWNAYVCISVVTLEQCNVLYFVLLLLSISQKLIIIYHFILCGLNCMHYHNYVCIHDMCVCVSERR